MGLPLLSGQQVIAALQKLGWEHTRTKGSHCFLFRPTQPRRPVTVPRHKELDRGTLRSILRSTDLTAEELLAALGKKPS